MTATEEEIVVGMCPTDVTDGDSAAVYADYLGDQEHPDEIVYRLAANPNRKGLEFIYGFPEGSLGACLCPNIVYSYLGITSRIAQARACSAWMTDNMETVKKCVKEWQRKDAALERASQGDGRALLEIRQVRSGLRQLVVEGVKVKGFRISDYCTSRKAIKEAKAILAKRCSVHTAPAPQNKYRNLYLAGLRKRAMLFAWTIHAKTPLFRSERASIIWGDGGTEDSDYPYKGRFKTWRATWKNAGVRFDNDDNPTQVIVENYLGKRVNICPISELPRQS